jgi:hypothetical protein
MVAEGDDDPGDHRGHHHGGASPHVPPRLPGACLRPGRLALDRQVRIGRFGLQVDRERLVARGRGQMNLIENSVRLLRDQVLTMQSPDQLGDHLDDLITGVDAVQASMRDSEAILAKIDVQPVSPIREEGGGERGGSTRVRG